MANPKKARAASEVKHIDEESYDFELAALDLGNPAHDLQRLLAMRLTDGEGVMKSMIEPGVNSVWPVEQVMASISRAAGPILLIAAIVGLASVYF